MSVRRALGRVGRQHRSGTQEVASGAVGAIRHVYNESWYFHAEIGLAPFRVSASAAPAWHAILKEGFPEVLRGTPFSPLERCPNAFNDKAGLPILIEIADTYRNMGDREGELGTLRNAATVSLVTTGRYPAGLLERIAVVCDAIEPGGFAGEVTLEYVRAMKRTP